MTTLVLDRPATSADDPPAPVRVKRNRPGGRVPLLRCRVAERDGAACFWCGTPFGDDVTPTLDHLMPWVARRSNAQIGLVLACAECNEAKGHLRPHRVLRRLGNYDHTDRALKAMEPGDLLAYMRAHARERFAPGLVPLF